MFGQLHSFDDFIWIYLYVDILDIEKSICIQKNYVDIFKKCNCILQTYRKKKNLK